MVSRKFKHWHGGNFNLSIGPYIEYLLKATKGLNDYGDMNLKRWELGIEVLYSAYYGNILLPKSFTTMKFQLDLTEIFYFKSVAFTISLIGFSF